MSNDNNQNDLLGTDDSAGFFEAEQEPDLFGETIPVVKPDIVPDTISVASDNANGSAEAMMPAAAKQEFARPQQDGYVVLARKYRPQTFDDIVGQQGVQQGLRGAIATGQISHSYLFSGPRGTGKTSTARILAKALNCLDNGPRPDPCGKCASCRAITQGSSLDVIEIDAASNTGVDSIRELKSGVVLAPFSKYKVYIVDEVHMLSNQAFNALLKTLEEPPPQVIFVLATTELHKVPETIISRCQTFMFRRFSLVELKTQLGSILDIETKQRGLTVTEEDKEKILDLVSRNAEGGMRDAQVTLDQVLVLSKGQLDFESVRRFLGMADIQALGSFVSLLHGRQSRELLELIDTLVTQGQDLELFVKGVCEHVRDLLLVKTAGKDTSLINVSEDRALELEQAANALSSSFMINTVDHFLKVVGEMKTSGQPRTVLELAVLKLTLVDPSGDLPNILKRLDELEKKNSDSGSSHQSEVTAAENIRKNVRVAPEPEQARVNSAPEAEPAPSAAPISITPAAGASHLTNADAIAQTLMERLKAQNPFFSLSFEKAYCGHQLSGNTLTIFLDPSCGMESKQVVQPKNAAIINGHIRDIAGPGISIKFEERRQAAMSSPSTPETAPSERPTSQNVNGLANETPAPAKMELSGEMPALPDTLKIYYPEEIREKTMVEVKPEEFQALMGIDKNLKELAERTVQAFGIDTAQLKFHRSTLAQ